VSSRTTSRRSHAAFAAASALALAVVLAGCGSGGDDTSADPTSDPSATESESPATTETPTETISTPAVAPASGPEIAVRGLRANAPEGWEAKPAYAVMSAAVPVGVIGTTVYVYRFPNSGLMTMDELGDVSRARETWKFKLNRLDDVVLDDQPAFHLAGKANPGEYIEKFGAIVNDDHLLVTFEFHNGEDKAYRDEIIGSVLATVDFRELTQ
jgi:hypothetical protein